MNVPPSFSAEVFTLFSTGVIVISTRTFARAQLYGVKHLRLDDYLMIIAILPYTAEIVLAYLARATFHGLANNAMTSQERTALQVNSEEYGWRTNGSKIQVAGWVILLTVLVLTLNILTDIYLMAIPTQDDATTGPQQAVAWAIRESFLAIIVSNTPVVWAWVRLKMDPAVPAVRRPGGYEDAQSRGRNGVGNGVDSGGWAFAGRGIPGDWRDRHTMSGVWSTCEHEDSGSGSGSMKPGITRSICIESRYQCTPVGNSDDENKSRLEIR
ncbi:integral membrane PTH11 [Fusarium albosuccineum]|uniref:Integral membrane PTH11 n=1 Tax=Fusarium albosuccineum TaxID=1237068 RepID=A0A8H4LC56_9HYPO|nr:integral membrane PTH11 [Fusarium albosuccineum]